MLTMPKVWDDRPPGNPGGDAVAGQLQARLGALMRQWGNQVEAAGGNAGRTDPDWRQRWYDETGEVLATLRKREQEARERGGAA
jgi:hypothetical protein